MEVEKSQYADEQLEALLHCLRRQDPNIQCPQGKKVTKMCLNQKCANALRCSDARCSSCGKEVHKECLINTYLEETTQLINYRTEDSREVMASLFKIEEELIQTIRKSRKDFLEIYLSGNLKKESRDLIDKIYTEKSYTALSGKQAFQMCQVLEKDTRSNLQELKHLIDLYSQTFKIKTQELYKLRERTFLKHRSLADSKVLKMKGNVSKEMNFIEQCLNKPRQFRLLFRASEHQFKAAEFHKHCDNIEDTFVLARTEFGKTVAGFTHYKWNAASGNVNDNAQKAFLIQVDLMQKMVNTNSQYLINCNGLNGPNFLDFQIGDECNSNKEKNSSTFPYFYNYQGPNKYTQNQNSYKAFSGATSGSNFRVLQYEVYQVIF